MSAIVNRDITSIISQSYSELGKISLLVGRNEQNGFDTSKNQKELITRGIQIERLLKVVLDHTSFNDQGQFERLLRCTPEEINTFLKCLVKITDIQDYPVAPLLFHKVKPRIISEGNTGNTGPQGPPGSDAVVNVIPDTGEDEISVEEEVISGVRTFKLSFSPYVAPIMSVAIQGTKIYEIGDVIDNKQININTTKGKGTILTLVSNYENAAFQAILNLVALNGITQPQTTAFVVSGQNQSRTFTFTLADNSGKPEGTVVASDSLAFYYPFLSGATDGTTPNHYQDLTKLVNSKADRSFNLNGTNKYFWIGYPASYGALSQLLDQNGFDAIGAFTEVLVNVTSVGKIANWTIQYRFYRTTLKTNISNANYTIKF